MKYTKYGFRRAARAAGFYWTKLSKVSFPQSLKGKLKVLLAQEKIGKLILDTNREIKKDI